MIVTKGVPVSLSADPGYGGKSLSFLQVASYPVDRSFIIEPPHVLFTNNQIIYNRLGFMKRAKS